jgi:MFS family permease
VTHANIALRRRLIPLYAAVFLQNFALWVPIEKLFLISIGFNAASVGMMAAIYAIVVPVLEVPSGILADRWSRRGVLALGSMAAIASVVIGGISQSVPTYMLAAILLGVFFAMQSGTLESMVFDTVLEETGDSDLFERTIGRVRVGESVALVTSALAGGAIAEVASLRAVYFLTAPLLGLSCLMLISFREPQLHKAEETEPLRRQVAATYRTLLERGTLRAVVALTVAGSVLMQSMLEFGPLWLVALVVPAFFYGPHWAGLTSALGLGGLLGARAWVTSRAAAQIFAVAMMGCGVVLATSHIALVVVGAQVLLTLIVVAISIPVMKRLHDAVPSTIRAGVASGVGTLTWLTFVPFALVFGAVSQRAGVDEAAWLLVAIAGATALMTLAVLPGARPAVVEATRPIPEEAQAVASFANDRFLAAADPHWPGHWAKPPADWATLGARVDGAEALTQVRAAIQEMPEALRQVIVERDIEGRTPEQVRATLRLSGAEESAMLNEARGRVRARLERYFAESGDDHERA